MYDLTARRRRDIARIVRSLDCCIVGGYGYENRELLVKALGYCGLADLSRDIDTLYTFWDNYRDDDIRWDDE